jgi:hypothetical protein
MKNNLEKSIKESLGKYEMSYDANAWSSLSKRLDQTMPVNPKSNLKWYFGGAATVVVIAASIALWNIDDTKSTNKIETSESTSSVTSVNSTTKSTADTQSSSKNGSSATGGTTSSEVNTSSSVEANEINGVITSTSSTSSTQQYTSKGTSSQTNTVSSPNPVPSEEKPTSKKIDVQPISNICLGETTSISNKNDVSLFIQDPNGTKTSVKANKSLSYSPENEGKYTVGYMENGQFNAIETFYILNSPKVDFSVDDQTKYENGLPTINLSTSSIGTSYVWNFESQKGTSNGKDVSVHYFNKGNYSISLTVQGTNGCSATESKTVRIEDDYNLLAVTAFDPLSNDIRKSSFMPFALTQRSVDFNLIIIDPKDGAIIFESNDATNSWKGIDRRNGQMVDANKTYIWRVVIDNPEKGEKSEYKGTIIRM